MTQMNPQPRTDAFQWESKQKLYEFFEKKADLAKQIIDQEIQDALHEFKPRKGEPIDPRQLWQKVGTRLARKFSNPGDKLYDDPFVDSAVAASGKAAPVEDSVDLFELPASPTKASPASAIASSLAVEKKTAVPVEKSPTLKLTDNDTAELPRNVIAHSDTSAPQPGAAAAEISLDLGEIDAAPSSPTPQSQPQCEPEAATFAAESVAFDESPKSGFFTKILGVFSRPKPPEDEEDTEPPASIVDKNDSAQEIALEELPPLEDLKLDAAKLSAQNSDSREKKADTPTKTGETPAAQPTPADDDEVFFEV